MYLDLLRGVKLEIRKVEGGRELDHQVDTCLRLTELTRGSEKGWTGLHGQTIRVWTDMVSKQVWSQSTACSTKLSGWGSRI